MSKPSFSNSPWILGAPQGGVLARHAPDDLEHLSADLAPGATRAQAPVEPEARAMPADNGFGSDQDERISPPWRETPQRDPKQAVNIVEARPRMLALEHRDLLTRGENLETEVVACAEERAQAGEEREHAISAL